MAGDYDLLRACKEQAISSDEGFIGLYADIFKGINFIIGKEVIPVGREELLNALFKSIPDFASKYATGVFSRELS